MKAAQLLAHFDRVSEAPGAVPRLRRFILDLAVRGKLVAQDVGDEPAAILLRRIRGEKARLDKAGKRKRVAEETADEFEAPFVLPMQWVWARLGDVAQYGIPDKAEANAVLPENTWVLDLEDIEKDTSRLLAHVELSARPFSSTKTVFKQGDVLFGKLRPYLNKVVIADRDGVCTTEIIPIRGYCGLVPEYTQLVLRSPLTMARVDRLMYGMKMPRLGTADATALTYPLPPLAEQHRIVAKVEELMALCDQLESAQQERERRRDRLTAASLQRLNQPSEAISPETQREHARFHLHHLPRLTTRPEHIKELRQTFFNLAVCGRLVAQDADDEPTVKLLNRLGVQTAKSQANAILPSIPVSWSWVTIDQIAAVGSGTTPSRDAPDYFSPVGTPWVTSGETSNAFITQTAQHISERAMKETSLKLYPPGTLIVAMYGQGKTRGQIAELSISATTNQACAAIVLKLKDVAHRRYVKLYFQKIYEEIRELAAGGAQPNLNGGKIKSTLIPLPPLAEQHRIVAKVDALMALCDQLEANLVTAETDSRRSLEAVLEAALAPA